MQYSIWPWVNLKILYLKFIRGSEKISLFDPIYRIGAAKIEKL